MQKRDKNPWEEASIPEEKVAIVQQNKRQAGSNTFEFNLRRILSVWPWVIVFGLIGFLFGKLYLRYTVNIYQVSTSVNIQQKEEITIGQALFGSTRDPFNDQLAFFKSPALAVRLVDSLNLQYHAIGKGRLKDKDLYKVIRWYLLDEDGKEEDETPVLRFTVTPGKDNFKFSADSIRGEATWGKPFMLGKYRVVVEKLKVISSETPIVCYSSDRWTQAFTISQGIFITSTKESNIININYSDISIDRAIDILNGLVQMYDKTLRTDKSKSFSQAIEFIDGRLLPLGKELDSIENALAHYKSQKGLYGITANGEVYMEKIGEFDKQLNDNNILKSVIESLEKFIANPAIKEENLSLVGVSDSYLQNIMTQYQSLRYERDRLALVATPNNPNLQLLEKQIEELRKSLETQVNTYKNNLKIAEANYQQNISQFRSLLKETPHQEKELIDKFRLQNIKETLFLTLLQKREEAAVSKASVTVDTKVYAPPVKADAPVKPSRERTILICVLAGMLLPFIYALLRELTNNKIISKKQLLSLSTMPVIAELEETTSKEMRPFIISQKERSMISEQIRSLRTNLSFYAPDKKTIFLLITSAMSGEGKSFLSRNLARSYSIQGKKVALLEFDLRRPKISKILGVGKTDGITSVLIGKNKPRDSFVLPDKEDENLHLFPAGTVPPNPQELMSSANANMQLFKDYLDEHYDVVVIDTPPFGIVADAQILGRWADVTLVMTRFGLTIKEQITEIEEWKQAGYFPSMALVLNGVKNRGYYGYKYGYYYYKRRYGYSYYGGVTDEKKGR